MGDGESVLILDVPGLAKFTNLQSNAEEEGEERGRGGVLEEHVERGYLLFSVYGQQFAVNVETVPRIERISKDQIGVFMGVEIIQYRGEIVPVVRLEELYDFETREGDRGDLYVIIFTIDGVRTGIVATEIYNVVGEIPDIDHRKFAGNSIVGHAILKDVITLVLDAVDLLTRLQSTSFREIVKVVRRRRSVDGKDRPPSGEGKNFPGREGSEINVARKSDFSDRMELQDVSGEDSGRASASSAPSSISEEEIFAGPGAKSVDRG